MRSLKGHGHWVNTMALSSEYALRTGAFDHTVKSPDGPKEAQQAALKRQAAVLSSVARQWIWLNADEACLGLQ